MANMYLVDYENVGDSAMSGVKTLVPGERVVVFFSKNAKALTFELWNELTECKGIKEMKMVENPGKNALDFQLSSHLGYAICKYPHFENFVIISKDSGFQTLVDFWKREKDVKVHLFPTIEEALANVTKVEETIVDEVVDETAVNENND